MIFDSLEIKNLKAKSEDSGYIFIKGSLPFYTQNDFEKEQINLTTNKFKIKTDNFNFLVDSELDLGGTFQNPVLGGNLSLNNGFINFNSTNQNKQKRK